MSKTDNNFDIVRLIGAFFVFTGHMYILLGGFAPTILGVKIHRLGIIVFFTIGGYLITNSWKNDRNYLRYIFKRFMRIIPALALFVIIASCIIGPLISSLTAREYFSDSLFWLYLKNIVLYTNYRLPGVFENNPYLYVVNGSLWSLPVEVLMYFLIPFLYEIGKRKNGLIHFIITLFICLFAAIHMYFFPQGSLVIYGIDILQVLSITPYYFIGSLIATIKFPPKIWNLQISIVVILLLICFTEKILFVSDFLPYITIPYVIFSFSFVSSPISLHLKNASKFTDISYGIYLYGFFIQQVIIEIFVNNNWTFSINMILIFSLFITTLCSLGSAYIIENPCQNLIKKILKF